MRRDRANDDHEDSGQDSFLDVVSNIVGILILLVMVVGMRASRLTPPEQQPEPTPVGVTSDDIAAATKTALKAERDAQVKLAKLHSLRLQSERSEEQRLAFATYVRSIGQEIEEKRGRLGENQRRDLATREKLYAAQKKLEDLTRRQVSLVSQTPKTKTIECLPPIGGKLREEVVMLRLKAGLVSLLPFKELNDAIQDSIPENLAKLRSRDSVTISVGPYDNFVAKLTIHKEKALHPDGFERTKRSAGSMFLLPTHEPIGVDTPSAILSDSPIMQEIRKNVPGKTSAVVFVYPDSYEQFQTLKSTLTKLGYSVASHLLPAGAPIGFSHNGATPVVQ